ncbi:hypothetical protein H2O64_05185 [Kordia sp. YSTF-M3]|uniref:Uncharacterized protein n=1 Tax=Kordia aestuariivivens TaxID=2759037 RepID=A0ABR7Q6T9_9FLAO|nr:hypothetical protein [Kordia aestuariivivens]MBC8754054.1 hypothetical protein [Kordia aestuariivivens]
MNIIEKFIKKHNGTYLKDNKESIYTPGGKYTYQTQTGILEIDGSKIYINFSEPSDAARTAEPIKIILCLDKIYDTELHMFPKNRWGNVKDFFFPKKTKFIPKKVRKQFYFGGDVHLHKKLVKNEAFIKDILWEMIYVRTAQKKESQIILTPSYGIYSVEHLEQLIRILKYIAKVIKQC